MDTCIYCDQMITDDRKIDYCSYRCYIKNWDHKKWVETCFQFYLMMLASLLFCSISELHAPFEAELMISVIISILVFYALSSAEINKPWGDIKDLRTRDIPVKQSPNNCCTETLRSGRYYCHCGKTVVRRTRIRGKIKSIARTKSV